MYCPTVKQVAPAADESPTMTKTADPTTFSAAGQTITYTYVISNFTQTEKWLTNLKLTDDKTTVKCDIQMKPIMLAWRHNLTCTSTYVTTEQDVSAGSVTNTAKLTAVEGRQTADGIIVADNAAKYEINTKATVILVKPSPTMTKTADPTTFSAAGQTITYTYVITNPTKIRLYDVEITDDKTAVDCSSVLSAFGGAISLSPGESKTCTSTYVTTEKDVIAGFVKNTATFSSNPDLTGRTKNRKKLGTTSATITLVEPPPTLTKTANPATFSAAGQTITYTYVITNPGRNPLPFSLTDDKAEKVTCPALTKIAAGASMTCTSTYVTTDKDVTAGSVTNTASLLDKSSGNKISATATIVLVQPILKGTVSYCYPEKDMSYINLPLNPQTDPKDVQAGLKNGSLTVQIGDVKGNCTVDSSHRLMTCGFPTSAFTPPETTINVIRNKTVIDVVKFDNYCLAPSNPQNGGSGGEDGSGVPAPPPSDGGGGVPPVPPDTGLD
jgi:hypothetical protein